MACCLLPLGAHAHDLRGPSELCTDGINRAAVGAALCPDLKLAVTDKNAATVYPATALSTQMGATSLNNNAATPSATWAPNGTAGSGSGASGNTFSVTISAGTGFAGDYADAGQTCTFNLLFTQTAA